MGYKEFEIRIPVESSEKELKQRIAREIRIKEFSFNVIRKSLDARKKNRIFWQYRVGIESESIQEGSKPEYKLPEIPRKKYQSTVIVVGSGPAGIFAALPLAEAGIKVTLIERGSNVQKRKQCIDLFESNGIFNAQNNYAFGEGGAGTFSDGKLTSRTKGISLERNYIYKNFIEAGAPPEISYMTHPHLGSDNLLNITANLRQRLIDLGGKILFDTQLEDLILEGDKIRKARTSKGDLEADYFVLAIGHSSTETYRMLIRRGVPFQTKNFALGMRAEHPQELINKAQWGVTKLNGVKAAEYRLTGTDENKKPVYSFCMCPGGIIVPSTAYKNANIVNGMSYYRRNGQFANAAIVAGFHPNEIINKEASPLESIEWLEQLERSFYEFSNGYDAPAINIQDFITNKTSSELPRSSYPFSLLSFNPRDLLPKGVISTMQTGLQQFAKKLNGYEIGTLIGLESKTSSPIQAIRDRSSYKCGYFNLYLAGEGSGWAGGIMSSAADGIRVALSILKEAN